MGKVIKLLDKLSKCPNCGHNEAKDNCDCPRSDCACKEEN